MGKTKEEEHEGEAPITPNKPRDPKLQAAKVHMLNGTCKDFDVPRGSDGEILFSAVTKDLSIEEREYFSLCFYDEQGIRHWLYNDKKILRQLKGLPWEFSFEVKFYPTAPSTLNDDAARYHLFLQLRKDTTNGRLPATIPTHALLSALIAQAQYGDCDNSAEYERFLKDVAKIPNFGPTEKQEQLVNLNEKIKELHKEQKGLTASEAELKFLETCKKLSMYGVFVFDAIDNENGKVGIGICATGFNIYKETIRIHRFAWQNIVKISYRKAIFSIKLKAGELEKKEVTLHYKVSDHGFAKRLWRCGVEHHTFFRLIQPEEKQKAGVFRWGSSRFRYQGRTQFQTKMASQMFDSHGGTVPRANSARLAQSYDNGLNKETITVEEKCTTMGEKLSSPLTSPGISYEINTKKKGGSTGRKVGSSLDNEEELVYTPVESPTSAAYYLSERSSLRSPYSSGAVSPNDWSAWGRDVSYRQSTARRRLFGTENDIFSHPTPILVIPEDETLKCTSSTAREADLETIPIQQTVSLYHRGFYTEQLREPTVRIQHYAPRNGYHPVERLEPMREMIAHPIRFFVDLQHSGESSRKIIAREQHKGVDEITEPDKENYLFGTEKKTTNSSLLKNEDLQPASIHEYSNVYYMEKKQENQPNIRLIARVTPQIREEARTKRQEQPNAEKKKEEREQASMPVVVREIVDEPEEQELRKYRYIARIRHEGEEDIVEKEEVKPEHYNLPSTSYDGPLEDTNCHQDLEHLPIKEHAEVYHTGQSWLKMRASPAKEAEVVKEPKKKAVLHLKSSAEESQPQVRLLARIMPSASEDAAKNESLNDSGSNLFGFLKKSGKKNKSTSSESSAMAVYPSTSDRYEGPVDAVDRNEDLANLPLENQPRVLLVSKPVVVREIVDEPEEQELRKYRYIARIRHEGEEDIVEKEEVKPEHYNLPSTSYDGPLEDTNCHQDLEHLPIKEHAEVYHTGQSWLKMRASPAKEAEVVKEPKKKAVLHLKSSAEESQPQVRLLARIMPSASEDAAKNESLNDSGSNLFGFLKKSGKKNKSASSESSAMAVYPSTSDRYEGPVDAVDRNEDLANLPLENQPRVPLVSKPVVVREIVDEPEEQELRKYRYIARIRHEGEEDIVEKEEVKPEHYNLPSTSYDGPLEDTNCHQDLEHLPIKEHAEVYHTGQSWLKMRASPAKEAEVVKEPKKKAVLHLKSSAEESQPQVRLLARIMPSASEDVAKNESLNDSGSNLFGFLKKSGKKNKSTSSESSAMAVYPSTSDRYEGPVDAVDRNEDLANLPLENQPRVPLVSKPVVVREIVDEPEEQELRKYRYIARIRHEGEEDIVEKEEVKPEHYNLPSTSYDGPLEDTNCHQDLEHLPIKEHAEVYHTGQSWLKMRASPAKEAEVVKEPKKKAVLHLKSSAEESQPQVRLLARIMPSASEDAAKNESLNDSGSNLFGFLKKSGKKNKSASSESSAMAVYPSTSDRYEGPVDAVDRNEDLANLPLENQPRVPLVSKPVVVREIVDEPEEQELRKYRYIARIRHEGEEDIVEKEEVKPEHYNLPSTSYDGPLEDTNCHQDLEHLPIKEHAEVYHTGQSWLKMRASPAKEAEVVKEPKKKAVLHLKSSAEESQPQVRLLARIMPSASEDVAKNESLNDSGSNLFGFLKKSGKKNKSTSSESSAMAVYPSTSDRYEGPVDAVDRNEDLANLPLENQPRVLLVSKPVVVREIVDEPEEQELRKYRYIARIRHEGEEDIVEKEEVKPEHYNLPSTSYDGPLEDTNCHQDLEHLPIKEHAEVYHTGQSWLKMRASPAKEAEVVKEPKKKAVLHLKSSAEESQPQVRLLARIMPSASEDAAKNESLNDSGSNLFGFLKKSGKKNKSASSESSAMAVYPSTSDRYEGPVDAVDRNEDLANLPLENQPRVPLVSKPVVVREIVDEPEEQELRKYRYIARIRHEGEEDIVEKEEVKPEHYNLPSTSYDGPLEDTNCHQDLEHLPIKEHAEVYHTGQSWLKMRASPAKEAEVVKEPKKKAVLHLKSSAEESQPQVRLLARIMPSASEDVAKNESLNDSGSNLFGFLKKSGKKNKSTSSESSAMAVYPSTSDRYEGPVDAVDRNEDLANLPLENQPRVPLVSKPVVVREIVDEPEEQELRKYRYIARIRHEGEEDIVEKEEVKPEHYNLPSTSYDGPLEDTNCHQDLEHLPIKEHAEVYHTGQSWLKMRASPAKEAEVVKEPKKKAVLHLKSSAEESQPQVRLLARIMPSASEDVAKNESLNDSGSNLFGFLKKSGKKNKSTSSESSAMAVYPSTSDRYEGPVDAVDRNEDLANLPLENQPRVPLVSKPVVVREIVDEPEEQELRKYRYIARIRHEGEEDIVEKEEVKPEHYNLPSTSYDGPLEDTNCHQDLEHLPIKEHAEVYHTGQSWLKMRASPAKEAEVVKEPKKKAVLHLKSSAEESQPQVRLLARIMPSASEDAAKNESLNDSGSNLFGFLKKSGKKNKSTSSESSAMAVYPSTSDRYEGPVDAVDRNEDLANLPLENQPRVPLVSKPVVVREIVDEPEEQELRKYRYIARIRHEGEEDIVEKEEVKPEHYNLPSTSYDGPLEDTNCHQDLEHLPIKEHAEVYHTGQSWLKMRASPAKEAEVVKEPKKKAVLHLKSSAEESQPQVRLLARIMPSASEDAAKNESLNDSGSNLFGFLKKSGKKNKSTSSESSAMAVYPSTSDRYEGPVDAVDRNEDLANLPLENQPRVPLVSKPVVVREIVDEPEEQELRKYRYIARIRHEGEEDIVEKEEVKPEHYNLPSTSYDGPLEDTNCHQDLEHLPIKEHAEVYHTGQSWLKMRASPAKEAEVVKEPKKKAVLHLKSSAEESQPQVRLLARIMPSASEDAAKNESLNDSGSNLFGFLKKSGKKNKSASSESSAMAVYPSTSDRYEGPVDAVDRNEDLANLPLENQPRVPLVSKPVVVREIVDEPEEQELRKYRYIARIRHEGEEDIVEKEEVKPEHYNLPSTSYDGPLEDTNCHQDLEHLPIKEHAEVYHTGQSWLKMRASPAKEAEVVKEPKKKAVLHLKSSAEESQPQVRLLARIMPSASEDVAKNESLNDSGSNLFGFLKKSGKKNKSTSSESSAMAVYPSTSDRYEGPVDAVDRNEDLANLPLENQPRVPLVSKPVVVREIVDEPEEQELRKYRYIARIRHEGEEDIVEKEEVKPEHYNLPSTSYDGPLEDTNCHQDLEHLPIKEHAEVYHTGQSWLKMRASPAKEAEVVKEPKKKAVLHLKSSAEESQPQVRLLARIMPSASEDVAKNESLNDSGSNLFGFLKKSGKKNKSTSSESSAMAVYPSTSDRYEGPVDAVDRNEDLANLPLENQPRVPLVSKPVVVREIVDEPEEQELRKYRYIARIRHEGEEDIVEKEEVKPEHYNLPSTSYDGPLEDTNCHQDLEHLPIKEHAEVYHTGQSWLKMRASPAKEAEVVKEPKKKAVLHLKSSAEESQPQVRLLARIMPSASEDVAKNESLNDSGSNLFGFLKKSGKKNKSTSSESSAMAVYPSTSDRYEGPVDAVDRNEDLANLPLENQPRVPLVSKPVVVREIVDEPEEQELRKYRYIARIRHEGEEDIVEKEEVKPEHYNLPSTSYDGPLEDTNCHQDLEHLPIKEHAEVYHTGQSWLKMRASPAKEAEVVKEPKKKAVLHLKSSAEESQPQVRLLARIMPSASEDAAKNESLNDSGSNLFGFLKKSGKKNKSASPRSDTQQVGIAPNPFTSEGTTADGQSWIEVRVERRVEVQLEPIFCLAGAGLGAVSIDEGGLIFTSTPQQMSPGRSLLSRLGFKSKKSKGRHEPDSSDTSSSGDEDQHIKVVPVIESLSTTIAESSRLNQSSPLLGITERTITVRALPQYPLPVSFEESGQPQTTVASWQETTVLPDNVTIEYDDQGNRITKTVKTSQVKHTVQKQTFQNYVVPDSSDPSLGEFVSSKTVTSGNRTIETITYKTEHDGIIETHVEHRVTINSEHPIDHDAELELALASATQMNPVEKIEVRQESHS